jgi:hypothetical protein
MDITPIDELVTMPARGTHHPHTGCFHIECPMPGGLELWLFGGWLHPKFEADRPQFQAGQCLGGYLKPVGVYSEEIQQRLEDSMALAGLAVEWVELPFPSMHRWFQFRVEPDLVRELFKRLQGFAAECA